MLDFKESQLQVGLDALNDEARDQLSFGVVRMDQDGTVTGYNKVESELSGLSAEKVLGKNFFFQVAPCTNNYLVAQRFSDESDMDDTRDYVFTLKMRPTKVVLRLLKKTGCAHMYLLVAARS